MILYGTGDPIAALDTLAPHVVTVHCKDGDWPPPDLPGALGEEQPLGEGAVGMERFIDKLKEIGYKGPLTIEREAARDSGSRRRGAISTVGSGAARGGLSLKRVRFSERAAPPAV